MKKIITSGLKLFLFSIATLVILLAIDSSTIQAVCCLPAPGTSGGSSGTLCEGTQINLGYEKKLLPLPNEKMLGGSDLCSATATGSCGRPGKCIEPRMIVIHTTTESDDYDSNYWYEYFASGAKNRGVGTQFVIDQNGKVLQMMELLEDRVEAGRHVKNYNDEAIGIELVDEDVFSAKSEVPTAQYEAALKLVRELMSQYNIPLGDVEADWQAASNSYVNSSPGVYGHYQLNPVDRADPGENFFAQFREDLR